MKNSKTWIFIGLFAISSLFAAKEMRDIYVLHIRAGVPDYRVSYSQQGEDIIVMEILDSMGIADPVYLDVGASHPMKMNNTFLFYLRGSRGVLVEPNPTLFELLKSKRKEDTVLNVGIGFDKPSEADYYISDEPTWNTFSKEHADRIVSEKKRQILATIKMKLVPINSVIAGYFKKTPDFLSLDTEGLDYEILKTLDFSKYKIKVICVETIKLNATEKSEDIDRFLKSKNYELRAMTAINSIYVLKEGK